MISGAYLSELVDKEKSDNNVYLLAEVTEEGLLGLTKPTTTAKPTPEPEPPPATVTPAPAPVEPTPEVPPEPKKSSDSGSVWLIIIVILACGGAGYYFKIVRPKQNAADPYEDEDDEDGFPDDEDEEIDLRGERDDDEREE